MQVFVAYARHDRIPVHSLVDTLREGGHEPLFDGSILPPGIDWPKALLKGIRKSDAFLYALTPESVSSVWCGWEFAMAIIERKPIIPVLMRSNTKIPDALSTVQCCDFTRGPDGRAVAQLMRGLNELTVVVPVSNAPPIPNIATTEERPSQVFERVIEEQRREVMTEIRKIMRGLIPGFDDKFPTEFSALERTITDQTRKEVTFKVIKSRSLIFGRTRVGKTTTINYLLDNPIFPTEGHLTCTLSVACGEHEGGLVFYDSPGIGDVRYQENITRTLLGIDQFIKMKKKDEVTVTRLIDLSSKNEEGPNEYQELQYEDFTYEMDGEKRFEVDFDFYSRNREKIAFKGFEVGEFREWSTKNFDFLVFVMSSEQGLPENDLELLVELHETRGNQIQLFKVFNVFHGRYAESRSQLSDEIINLLSDTEKRLRDARIPNETDWIIIDSRSGKGLNKLIDAFAQSLPPHVLRNLEKTVRRDYSHVIHQKLVEHCFDYVSHVASLVAVFPADHTTGGKELLSFALGSVIVMAEFLFSSNIQTDHEQLFDKLADQLKKDKKKPQYYERDESHWRKVYRQESVIKYVDDPDAGILAKFFRDEFNLDVGKKFVSEVVKTPKDIVWVERSRRVQDGYYIDVGGLEAIALVSALGMSIREILSGSGTINSSIQGFGKIMNQNRQKAAKLLMEKKDEIVQIISEANQKTSKKKRLDLARALQPLVRNILRL